MLGASRASLQWASRRCCGFVSVCAEGRSEGGRGSVQEYDVARVRRSCRTTCQCNGKTARRTRRGHMISVSFALSLTLVFVQQCQSLPERIGVETSLPLKTGLRESIPQVAPEPAVDGKTPGVLLAQQQDATPGKGAEDITSGKAPALRRIPAREMSADFLQAISERKEKERREGGGEEERTRQLVDVAVNLSLAVNVCLFIAKVFAARVSGKLFPLTNSPSAQRYANSRRSALVHCAQCLYALCPVRATPRSPCPMQYKLSALHLR